MIYLVRLTPKSTGSFLFLNATCNFSSHFHHPCLLQYAPSRAFRIEREARGRRGAEHRAWLFLLLQGGLGLHHRQSGSLRLGPWCWSLASRRRTWLLMSGVVEAHSSRCFLSQIRLRSSSSRRLRRFCKDDVGRRRMLLTEIGSNAISIIGNLFGGRLAQIDDAISTLFGGVCS